MLVFKPGWDAEKKQYAQKYGPYSVYLKLFNEVDIMAALFKAKGHYQDHWVNKFIREAMDPFNTHYKVTIEQGTHQVEHGLGGGFYMHFTGRDSDGVAFHFYVRQNKTGLLQVFRVTYMNHGTLSTHNYV